MMELPAGHRFATRADDLAMAQLVNMAGEGLPLYLWTQMAEPDQSPWDLGRERARRESGAFSYKNTIVREESGKVVASLVNYPIADTAEPIDYSTIPPMFVPLQQLEDMVPGTWYVNVLATYPEFRGRGYGKTLLSTAEALAINAGKSAMSIIVADSNTGARRLYRERGYREIAQKPMIKEGWQSSGSAWVLLTKNL